MGQFVHNETTEWALTSDWPTDFVYTCDENSVYNEMLPGRLGMFVYPNDVRFHMTGKHRTSRADFNTVMCSERAMLNREHALNMQHLTVSDEMENDFVPNQDTLDDSEEEEEDNDEEEDEENAPLEECLESDEGGGV